MSNRTLTKKLASVKPGTVFVGVDLALDQNVAVVLTERAEQLTRFRFPNERDGYDYFYGRVGTILKQRQAPGVLVGMEPTNYFWKLLAATLFPLIIGLERFIRRKPIDSKRARRPRRAPVSSWSSRPRDRSVTGS